MEFVINHNYPKDKALTMVKKALSGKFAIIKDDGFTLKAGAPTAPATIVVAEEKVTVSGGIISKLFVDSIGNEIKLYFEESISALTEKGEKPLKHTTVLNKNSNVLLNFILFPFAA